MEDARDRNEECCIICTQRTSEKDSHLICPQTYDSWLTLLKAAETRKYDPITDAAKELGENEFPKIYYHRKCRSIFTMKRDLETILKREANESLGDEAVCSSKRLCRRVSESRVNDPKSREKLTKAVELRADQTLRECATQKGDRKILAITSRDIVAAEAHYHLSCYKNYTRVKKKGCKHSERMSEDDAYQMVEREAFADLFEHIRTVVIPSKKIVPVSSLTTKLESSMLSGGIISIRDSTRKHIRRRLESELENSVQIYPDDKGKLLMVPDSVQLRDAVLEIQSLRKELGIWKTKVTDLMKITAQVSSAIRSAVKEDKEPTPFPFHPSNVTSTDWPIPYELERFLIGLLTGDPDVKCPSHRVSTLVQSFGQDLVYAVTCGQQKPPKHMLLPYAVKTLTGNVEIIKLLNKFGHGVSYSQLEENETALCLQKLAASLNQKVALPACIKPHVFTNLAWDNIDRLEETLTGKGTSHRVNGIAVQPKVYGPDLHRAELPHIERKKQRSVSVEHQELDMYVAGGRVGPQPLITRENHVQESQRAAQVAWKKNLIWFVVRQTNQSVPSWTGFNIRIRDEEAIAEDVVGYLPTINAPATELNTVFEILNRSELIRKQLLLETIVVVMDQAIFAKATEIVWKQKEKFSNVVLRMGSFHTICNALSIIGKRFRDAGLKDICIEAGIVAEGSINGVLDGKHYNRAVRVHKYIYEALMRLVWAEFLLWKENDQEASSIIGEFLSKVNDMACDLNQQNFSKLLNSTLLTKLISMWNSFLEHLHRDNGELSAYWMSYIDMVENIILDLLHGSREGNWNLHLNAIRYMIPWCFAYDKVNYARYLSAYYAEMTNLSEKKPDVYEAFQAGQFSVQISCNNPFGRIPVDQTTEVTVNKDTQTPGGTARFSLKPGAIKRYYLTAEYRSAFLGQVRNIVQGKGSKIQHAELQETRIKKTQEAVSAVVQLIQGWINPFAEKQDLVSISTARTAPADIVSDLMKAEEIGEQCYSTFKEERLEKDPPAKKFHDTITTNKLKTFSNLCKKKEVKSGGRIVILKADRSLFGRIIVMAWGRDLKMDDILSHPLGPLPWSLSTPDGLLRKTSKSSLATTLQKNVAVAQELPGNSASVVDGMNLVQRIKGDQATFGDVAVTVLLMALKEGGQSKRIDVVFDTYQENSIKNSERSVRGEETGHQLQSITGTQIVRQWRTFLSRIKNKSNLITFIVNEWRKEQYREKLQEKILYATVDEKCYRITSQGSMEVSALQCFQEEADGRLLLHAKHAANEGYHAVVICSEDTDVFIMSLAFHDKIGASLFQKCGTKTRRKVIDISKVAATVGMGVCRALIGMHAFTGCDTVSAFAGRGKAKALKLLVSNVENQDMFFKLGREWDLSQELMDKLEAFTCLLYAPKLSSTRINELRYHLFCAKKGEIESHQLPPCKDCLVQHALRANYQAGIWQRCLQQDPQVPSPIGRGWKLEKQEQLVIHWMEGQPAPQAILDLLACNCARKCELPKCECMANGLKCTDMCRLPDCDNQPNQQESEESADEFDDDELDDDY